MGIVVMLTINWGYYLLNFGCFTPEYLLCFSYLQVFFPAINLHLLPGLTILIIITITTYLLMSYWLLIAIYH